MMTQCGWCTATTPYPHIDGWSGFGPVMSDEPSPEIAWLCPSCADSDPPTEPPSGCTLIEDHDAPAAFAVWSPEGDIIGTGDTAARAIQDARKTIAAWKATAACPKCHATLAADELASGKCINCMLRNFQDPTVTP